ncbi:MAG TPA: glycosyltransferase family 2 protein [Patescibacteria group bacterium]|nr:glycosyltransferase family 2 protein [Patescibacteria group bacterium]
MKLKPELVSILLPVQNAARFLPQCLDSLKEQNYQQVQIIAIDDFSSDNSYAILKKFQKIYKNLQVYRNKKRYGLATCYNRALKRAKGQFVAFMNPHDINTESRFKRQMNFLLQNPKTVAVGTQYHLIDENSRKLERSNLPHENEVIYDNAIHASSFLPETVMINRAKLPKDLLYFKHNKYPFVFTEVFLKFFTFGTVANIAHALYYRREGIKKTHQRKESKLNQALAMAKLWISAKSYNDTAPSLRSLFPQLVKGI